MGIDISEILSSPLDTLHFGIFLFGNLALFRVTNIRRADSEHVFNIP
jgi:hypothetical protein